MKKVFLFGVLLVTLLFVSVPAYACLPEPDYSLYGGESVPKTAPKKMSGWVTYRFTALPMNTEGYTPILSVGESSCGKTMIYVKDELLIGIIAISGIIAGVMTSQVMRRKRAKK